MKIVITFMLNNKTIDGSTTKIKYTIQKVCLELNCDAGKVPDFIAVCSNIVANRKPKGTAVSSMVKRKEIGLWLAMSLEGDCWQSTNMNVTKKGLLKKICGIIKHCCWIYNVVDNTNIRIVYLL